jgi:hypothetical protein
MVFIACFSLFLAVKIHFGEIIVFRSSFLGRLPGVGD